MDKHRAGEWARTHALYTGTWAVWGLTVLVFAFLAYLYLTAEGHPLEFRSPQVVTSTVPVSISDGEPIRVTGFKCNHSDHPVTVISSAQWRRLDVRPHTIPTITAEPGTFAPRQGCDLPGLFSNELPPGLVPGVWQIEGFSTVITGGEQTESWVTEAFEVIP